MKGKTLLLVEAAAEKESRRVLAYYSIRTGPIFPPRSSFDVQTEVG